jgi:DNA-binding IclR family transcriptional regulator
VGFRSVRAAPGFASRSGPGTFVPTRTSVDRALALLGAFENDDALGVTELARRADLPKSTAHRLLAVLEQQALISRSGREYRLGLKLFELGCRVSASDMSELRDAAIPYLADLYESTRQTVHLAILDRGEVVCVLKLHGSSQRPTPLRIGARMPAHCTAVGKALLAFSPPAAIVQVLQKPLRPCTGNTLVRPRVLIEQLKRIRADGIAFDRQETELGLACAAAPIFDKSGRCAGAISASGAPRTVESTAGKVRSASQAIARVLGSATSLVAPLFPV